MTFTQEGYWVAIATLTRANPDASTASKQLD